MKLTNLNIPIPKLEPTGKEMKKNVKNVSNKKNLKKYFITKVTKNPRPKIPETYKKERSV